MKTYNEMINWAAERNVNMMLEPRKENASEEEFELAYAARINWLVTIAETYGVTLDKAITDASHAASAYRKSL